MDPVSVMVGLPHTWRAERRSRAEADELLDAFDLGDVADQFVDELSTGTRRILELACVVARSPRLICLDEPTAGIAQREIEALGPFLLRLRDELDASILVIEHDMPFLTGVSDRMYCLDLGRLIAEGTPAEVVHRTPRSSPPTSAPTPWPSTARAAACPRRSTSVGRPSRRSTHDLGHRTTRCVVA